MSMPGRGRPKLLEWWWQSRLEDISKPPNIFFYVASTELISLRQYSGFRSGCTKARALSWPTWRMANSYKDKKNRRRVVWPSRRTRKTVKRIFIENLFLKVGVQLQTDNWGRPLFLTVHPTILQHFETLFIIVDVEALTICSKVDLLI